MGYVVRPWWWFRYSHNGQLAIDVPGGGVGRLVVVLVSGAGVRDCHCVADEATKKGITAIGIYRTA